MKLLIEIAILILLLSCSSAPPPQPQEEGTDRATFSDAKKKQSKSPETFDDEGDDYGYNSDFFQNQYQQAMQGGVPQQINQVFDPNLMPQGFDPNLIQNFDPSGQFVQQGVQQYYQEQGQQQDDTQERGSLYSMLNRNPSDDAVDNADENIAYIRQGGVSGSKDDSMKLNRDPGDMLAYDFCGEDNDHLEEAVVHTVKVLVKFLVATGEIPADDCRNEEVRQALGEVEELNLANREIEDITPLIEMNQLKRLNLTKNNLGAQTSALNNLWELVNLEVLVVSENKIKNIDGLANNKELKFLDVSRNEITNVNVLSHLKKLEYLNISHNDVTSVVPLKTKALKELRINFVGNRNISRRFGARELVKPPDCEITGFNMDSLKCTAMSAQHNPFIKDPLGTTAAEFD